MLRTRVRRRQLFQIMAEETNHVSFSFRDAGLVEVCRQAPRLLLTTKKQAARRPGRVLTTHIKKRTARSAFGQSGRLMLTLSLPGSDPSLTWAGSF